MVFLAPSASRSPHAVSGRRSQLWALFVLIVLGCGLGAPTVWAQPAEISVPEPLQAWVPWVLEEHPDLACPRLETQRLCAWPGQLRLDLDDTGGPFRLQVVADRELELPLPGDAGHWPRDVTLNGAPALLLRRGTQPTVRLPPGNHQLAGRFAWQRIPESLAVPPGVARVALRLRGRDVASPRREDDGRLWLEAIDRATPDQDRLELTVSRKLAEGVPLTLTVHFEFRVSGRAREVDLGRPLPDGMTASWLDGDLPARLEDGGRLVVQLRPGRRTLRLVARSQGPVESLALTPRPAPWPETEVWVFAADPKVRAVDPGGVPAVDPDRTTLPDDWRGLPAFRLRHDDVLTLRTLRRGAPEPPPDAVTLHRDWWLAFAGDRFVVRDRLAGTLHTGGRLTAQPPATLGRFRLGEGESAVDTVITHRADEAPGVETRASSLVATAELTYPRGGRLPAVGWNRDVTSLTGTLHLPPGWIPIVAFGVDRAPGTWIERWTLLDLFFLLITSLAASRLLGRVQGLGTLLLLTLAWHEPHATGLWVWWLLLLASLALRQVLREGRGRRFGRGLQLLVAAGFAIQLFVFCGGQLRTGLFPQLDKTTRGPSFDLQRARIAVTAEAPSEMLEAAEDRASTSSVSPREKLLVLGSGGGGPDPDALPQTGPGIPTWRWNDFALRWNGPVSEVHEIRLWLISPAVEGFLSLLRVALALLLAGWLRQGIQRADTADDAPDPPSVNPESEDPASADPESADPASQDQTTGSGPGTGVALLLALLPGLLATPLEAQEPNPAAEPPPLLDELERRLLEPPACHPQCVEVSQLRLEASGERLRLQAEVHAAAPTAWRLPGPAASWSPETVRRDGQTSQALLRLDDGFLALRLSEGRHQVELVGPAMEGLDLQFHQPPRILTWRGQGWRLDGLRPDQPPPASVQLNRVVTSEGGAESAVTAGALTPWLVLQRTVNVGLPWEAEMVLERHGPTDRPVRLAIPLLPGEAVLDSGLDVEAGTVTVVLERGETVRRWRSQLDESPELTLTATDDPRWLERWALVCSPVFHCETDGLTPVSIQAQGQWRPQWQPWPGETVTLRVDRPAVAEGATTTLDAVELDIVPGRRLLAGSLQLTLRSSRGGEHVVRLPEAAELQSFTLDGAERPIQNLDGMLSFTVQPGTHQVALSWRQPHRHRLFERFPAVVIDGRAVNVRLSMELPPHRWLLWVGGPSWGPVVAFWQVVLVIALAAWILGRLAPTPLRGFDWFLLGLGMTQIPWVGPVIVVVWLVVLANRRPTAGRWWSWNLQQLGLLGLSMVSLVLLYAAVHAGLVIQPDMQVVGASSESYRLSWIVDASEGALPQPWVLWLPLFLWRVLMLGWALWLAGRLLRWLPWVWERLTVGPLLASPSRWREFRRQHEATVTPTPSGDAPSSGASSD